MRRRPRRRCGRSRCAPAGDLHPELPEVRRQGERGGRRRGPDRVRRRARGDPDLRSGRGGAQRRDRHDLRPGQLLRRHRARDRRAGRLQRHADGEARERRHRSAEPDPPGEDERLLSRPSRRRHPVPHLHDQGAAAKDDGLPDMGGDQAARRADLPRVLHRIPRRDLRPGERAGGLHRARARHGRRPRLALDRRHGPESGTSSSSTGSIRATSRPTSASWSTSTDGTRCPRRRSRSCRTPRSPRKRRATSRCRSCARTRMRR